MPSVSFFLMNPYLTSGKLSPKECRIYIDVIQSRKERSKIRTPYTIFPRDWDFKKQEAKISCPYFHDLNHYLSSVKRDVISRFIEAGALPFNSVMKSLKVGLHTSGKTKVPEVFRLFLESVRNVRHDRTVAKYRSIEKHLIHDDFSNYTLQWFDDIISGMIREKKLNDTINKTIGCFRTFFSWAKDRGYHQNNVFDLHTIGPQKSARNEIVALTKDDLTMLRSIDLSSSDKMVLDCFLLSCYTGARWSDIYALNKRQVTTTHWKFEAYKTRQMKRVVTIPFMGFCAQSKEIIARMNFQGPIFTEQHVNRTIKQICRTAGLVEMIRTTRMSGKNQIVYDLEKCEYVSFHTGRRTFISILLNQGTPASVVMKLTGISSMKTLMKYLDTTDEDVIRELGR